MGNFLLDAADVAKHLGISRRTFESLIKKGCAPAYVRIGRQRRWRHEDIEAFLEKNLNGAAMAHATNL